MDDVGHPFEELLGLVQQLQNVPGVQSLSGENKQTLISVNAANQMGGDSSRTFCSLKAARRVFVSETERGNERCGPV